VALMINHIPPLMMHQQITLLVQQLQMEMQIILNKQVKEQMVKMELNHQKHDQSQNDM
jgi:hypothetical protein